GSVTGAAVDGSAIGAPTIAGTSLTFAVGALADGDHALTGRLVDLSGHSHPFRVNFTVWSGAITNDVPPIAKNANPDQTTTIPAADGSAQVTVPSGAYTWKSPAQDDWLVVRVHPTAPASDPGPGLAAGAPVIDVTASWNSSGILQHAFSRALDVLISSGAGPGLIPATLDNGAWRLLRAVPAAGSLPSGWSDGFYTDASGVHILTMHLSQFTLLKDLQPPEAMQDLAGVVASDGLTIRWVPGNDNSGSIAQFTLFVNGEPYANYGGSEYEAKLGEIQPGDTRSFTMREVDAAGNVSEATKPLLSVPPVAGQTLDAAKAALAAAGFRVGNVSYDPNAAEPAGTVTQPNAIVLQTLGTAVDVTVSGKAVPVVESKLAFSLVGTKEYAPKTRAYVAARVKISKASQLVATLYSPRHVRLYTWRVTVKAGARVVKLRMPKQVQRPGLYTIVWSATSQTQVVRHTQKVRVVGVVKGRPVVIPQKPVEVVLAGDPGTRDKLALGIGTPKAKLQATTSVDDAFALAGNPSRNVQVVVVDVDRYGVSFLRDLRTLFPSIRLVAVSSSPRALAQARRVGANAALPRASTTATIVRTIRGLAGLK
ncbi:MAG TPA: PASTA domain-containing protein, partial [Gaiellaceae bacterium]